MTPYSYSNGVVALEQRLLERQKFRREEVAKVFNIPMHLLQEMKEAGVFNEECYGERGGRRRAPITKDDIKGNRFYIGSRGVFNRARGPASSPGAGQKIGWGHATLVEAIDHAKKVLEANDDEEQFIVKIVRVVRRKPTPIVVEEV